MATQTDTVVEIKLDEETKKIFNDATNLIDAIKNLTDQIEALRLSVIGVSIGQQSSNVVDMRYGYTTDWHA